MYAAVVAKCAAQSKAWQIAQDLTKKEKQRLAEDTGTQDTDNGKGEAKTQKATIKDAQSEGGALC